jgi:chromosome segregation ATPase
VDVIGRKVESQVQFWSLLGPLLILLSIAVLLFKVSTHWYFPVSALIGIPLCVKWKMKGMAAALCCLFLLSGIGYQHLELDDRYWHVGLALAMAFSFIVLTLSLEEAEGLVNKLQLESQSRLDNFVLLDEKWKGAEQEWISEKEKAKSEMTFLTQEVAKIQEDKQTFYKLAQLAKDELVQVREQHDRLLQDILYKKQQIAQLHERLEETEMTVQGFVNSDAEKQIQTLTDRLTDLECEKETLKAKIALTQTETHAWQQEKEQLGQELQICQEREKICLLDQQHLQQERVEQQNIFQSLQNRCLILEQEKNTLLQTQIGLQQQCEQMRYLETQLRQTMQQSQRKIQDLEIKLASEEQQKEVCQQLKKDLEEQLLSQEKQIKQRDEQHKVSLQQFQYQLQQQKEKAEAQIEHFQQQVGEQKQREAQALEQEIQVIKDRYQRSQEDLLQAKHELEAKSEAFAHIQEKVRALDEELHRQQTLVQHTTQQMQKLEELKSQLEQVLQQTQEQLQLTRLKLESTQHDREKLPYEGGNTRRIEAMYIQLKEQFQEKCTVLHETRRELFHANEALLKWQKENEEETVFGQSMNERSLQRNFLQLGQQYEHMQQQYQQEIDDLMQLVEHLLRQML